MRKGMVVGLGLVAVLVSGCTRVGPGYVGIKVSQAGSDRGVSDVVGTTGWVFYNPFLTNVLEYPTFVQQVVLTASPNEGGAANDSITFSNKDQMAINADISFAYHLDAGKVSYFYVKFRSDDLNGFTHGYLKSLIRDKFNDIAGRYTMEQIMGDNGPFLKEVREAIQKDVSDIGVVLESQFGFIGVPRPPKQVIDSINAKAQANQVAMQLQNEVAQAEASGRKTVATAQAAATAAIAKAEGEAKSLNIWADATASANRKVADSITEKLIDWQKAKQWDGKLPQVTGGVTPFLSIK